jgi:anti-sigma factor RsiW
MIPAMHLPPECANPTRRLWEYLDDVLPEAEAREVRRHLAKCRRCRPCAEFAQRLLNEIAAVRPKPVDPAALRDRIVAALSVESSLMR